MRRLAAAKRVWAHDLLMASQEWRVHPGAPPGLLQELGHPS